MRDLVGAGAVDDSDTDENVDGGTAIEKEEDSMIGCADVYDDDAPMT